MIVYSLKCDKEHAFEDWFSSAAAFEELAAADKLVCPTCRSHRIVKAPMAPAVSGTKGRKTAACPVAESTGQLPSCAGACGCFPG